MFRPHEEIDLKVIGITFCLNVQPEYQYSRSLPLLHVEGCIYSFIGSGRSLRRLKHRLVTNCRKHARNLAHLIQAMTDCQ